MQYLASGRYDLKYHGRGGRNEFESIFALQPLLHDFHVQHAEETAAETKSQCCRGLRLKMQRRIIQAKLLQRLAKIFIVIRLDRKQSGKYAGLHLLESG